MAGIFFILLFCNFNSFHSSKIRFTRDRINRRSIKSRFDEMRKIRSSMWWWEDSDDKSRSINLLLVVLRVVPTYKSPSLSPVRRRRKWYQFPHGDWQFPVLYTTQCNNAFGLLLSVCFAVCNFIRWLSTGSFCTKGMTVTVTEDSDR